MRYLDVASLDREYCAGCVLCHSIRLPLRCVTVARPCSPSTVPILAHWDNFLAPCGASQQPALDALPSFLHYRRSRRSCELSILILEIEGRIATSPSVVIRSGGSSSKIENRGFCAMTVEGKNPQCPGSQNGNQAHISPGVVWRRHFKLRGRHCQNKLRGTRKPRA